MENRILNTTEIIGSVSDNEAALLDMLRKNARMNLAEASRSMRMPHSTLHKMMKRLSSDARIVKKHTSLVDFQKIGFMIGCFYIARTYSSKKQNMESLIGIIGYNKNVNSLYTTSEQDIMIEAWFRSMAEVVDFRDILSEFAVVEEHEIIGSIEQEKFLVGRCERTVGPTLQQNRQHSSGSLWRT